MRKYSKCMLAEGINLNTGTQWTLQQFEGANVFFLRSDKTQMEKPSQKASRFLHPFKKKKTQYPTLSGNKAGDSLAKKIQTNSI